MKIINIVGTRPNFMKIAPIIKALNAYPEIEHILVHTGQHYDEQLSDKFFRELGIPDPDVNLNVGSNTHTKQVAEIMVAFEKVCDDYQPDYILVVGDVNSTMACSLVAAKKGIKIIHVEAGIRSFDRTMPEEINRLVTDSITDYLLPPSMDAVENLRKEGHADDKICMVGNVMIDTLKLFSKEIQASTILEEIGVQPKKYAVLTLHRPSNVDDAIQLRKIIDALAVIQETVEVVFPIHPRSLKMLASFGFDQLLATLPGIKLVAPLGYFDFGKLVSNAQFALTDSGGIQEETTVYGIPCITIRENTERPITITEGTNELAGTDTQKIIDFANTILKGEWKKGSVPNMWDGKAAIRIAEFLNNLNR
jgi:UDP-N-acetylglucosamine 2-epimerase (non-hydrolysing)